MYYLFLLFIAIPTLVVIIIYLLKTLVRLLKERKEKAAEDIPYERKTYVAPKYIDEDSDEMNFKIVGVTFKDGRTSRQTALRMLYFKDPPMVQPINFEFEEYEYEGSPAVKVKANGRILGNVPANLVDKFLKKYNESNGYTVKYKVFGGGDKSFGCALTIKWKSGDE